MRRIDGDSAVFGAMGVTWRKSRYSNPCGSCVEMAELGYSRLAIRNSRHPRGAMLVHSRAEMAAFIHSVKIDEFDHAGGADTTQDRA